MSESNNYRTYAHELGHYAFGFYDEYLFVDAAGNVNSVDRCGEYTFEPYSFMDRQYEAAGDRASEMSSAFTYEVINCRNTEQYVKNGMSCWDFLEKYLEGVQGTDSIWVPVYKPDDRSGGVTAGIDYFSGPNDGVTIDYDVSSLVIFPIHNVSPSTYTVDVVTHDMNNNRLGNIDVILQKPRPGGWRDIPQGKTSDVSTDSLSGGGIYVLGAENGDQIVASTDYTLMGIANRSLSPADVVNSSWLTGTITVDQSSASLNLEPIAGNWPLVCDLGLGESTSLLSITSERTFSALPMVTVDPESGNQQMYEFSVSTDGYDLELNDTLEVFGSLRVSAIDDSLAEFSFRVPYTVTNLNDNLPGWLLGTAGGCELMMDSTQSGLSKGIILSSPYPVIRTGLAPITVQAGDAHSLGFFPADSLSGNHSLRIRYADADLRVGDNLIGDESTLSVYRWAGKTTGWEVIGGGTVDTIDNVVYSQITSAGIYAAFTTDILTGVEDKEYGNLLPDQFKLTQNYPNPFNPVTTIDYSVLSISHITIEIYNVIGQKIRTLVDETKPVGEYQVAWDGRSSSGQPVATGVYLYRFKAGDYSETKKMLLLK